MHFPFQQGIQRTATAAPLALFLVTLAACGSSSSKPTPAKPSNSGAAAPGAQAVTTRAATGAAATARSAATPPVAAPSVPAALPTALGTIPPGVATVILTPPPPSDSSPCKPGQIKGNTATKTLYAPGLPGYSQLHDNVQCFDTIEKATAAGFKLPGQ